jgi:hypothetical protein
MTDLLDLVREAEQLRDEGMAATEAADHTVLNDGYDTECIDREIAYRNRIGEPWSANDIREVLPGVRQPLIGARVRAAAMRKKMRKVGYTPSTLPSTHSHPIAVWRGVSS